MKRLKTLACAVALVVFLAGFARAVDDGAKSNSATEESKFIRLRRTDDNRPAAMETAVARYASEKRPGVGVDLIGAVHVGDRAYYDELNKLFEGYEVVLYELVAPEGTQIP